MLAASTEQFHVACQQIPWHNPWQTTEQDQISRNQISRYTQSDYLCNVLIALTAQAY